MWVLLAVAVASVEADVPIPLSAADDAPVDEAMTAELHAIIAADDKQAEAIESKRKDVCENIQNAQVVEVPGDGNCMFYAVIISAFHQNKDKYNKIIHESGEVIIKVDVTSISKVKETFEKVVYNMRGNVGDWYNIPEPKDLANNNINVSGTPGNDVAYRVNNLRAIGVYPGWGGQDTLYINPYGGDDFTSGVTVAGPGLHVNGDITLNAGSEVESEAEEEDGSEVEEDAEAEVNENSGSEDKAEDKFNTTN